MRRFLLKSGSTSTWAGSGLDPFNWSKTFIVWICVVVVVGQLIVFGSGFRGNGFKGNLQD